MRYRRAKTKGGTFFFTVVTYEREVLFEDVKNLDLLKEAIKHVKLKHPFRMDAFVFLPDHLHCIWTLPENDNDFSTRWMLIKSYFSRNIELSSHCCISLSRFKKRERCLWQRRFWEHEIKDEGDLTSHIEYIHYNPVKHGHVFNPVDWVNSSFHHYVKKGIYESNWGSIDNALRDHVGLRVAQPNLRALGKI